VPLFCFLERRPRFLSTLQAQVNLGRGWRDARGNAASEKLSDAFKVPDVGVSLPLLSRRRFFPFLFVLVPPQFILNEVLDRDQGISVLGVYLDLPGSPLPLETFVGSFLRLLGRKLPSITREMFVDMLCPACAYVGM